MDQYTNNFSLFFLLEEVTPSLYPAKLQVHTHAFFEVDEADQGVDHEVRLVVSGAGTDCFFSEAVEIKPTAVRHRVRLNGLVLPEPGRYHVRIETRRKDDDGKWVRDLASWPIQANTPLQ